MPKLMSLAEFETRTMYGCTEDAYVFGMGFVQWKPVFSLSDQPDSTSVPYAYRMLPAHSLYISPRYELTVSPDTSEYRKEIARELKQAITRGTQYYDLQTGEYHNLPNENCVDVQMNNDDEVTITVQYGMRQEQVTMPLEMVINYVKNPVRSSKLTIHTGEIGSHPIDFGTLSQNVRKISGYFITVNGFLQPVVDKMLLYSKTPRLGGESTVFIEKTILGMTFRLPWGINLNNSTILKLEKWSKLGGGILGGTAISLGVIDMQINGIKPSNVIHTAMATFALIPHPATRVAASIYFGLDWGMSLATKRGIGEWLDHYFIHTDNAKNDIQQFLRMLNSPQFIDSPIQLPSFMNSQQKHKA